MIRTPKPSEDVYVEVCLTLGQLGSGSETGSRLARFEPELLPREIGLNCIHCAEITICMRTRRYLRE